MDISYVLPSPALSGGNKVIFQHARILRDLGHQVTILGEGPPPGWIRLDLPYQDHAAAPPRLPPQDLVIATYWTTIELALRLELGPVAHFCQGYEGHLVHLRESFARIEAAYSLPLPALTVSPHLGELLSRRFGRASRVVPPPRDPEFRPTPRFAPRRRPWIAVPGIFQAEVKDVATALEAVRELRRGGVAARVLRFSALPLEAAERDLLDPERYLCAVPPERIARELRRCDLLLLPSREGEGFGLPVLEAMASGVPVVASRIPSLEGFAAPAAELVAPGDAGAFARAARGILTGARRWRRRRREGLRLAAGFDARRIAPRLDAAVRWAAGLSGRASGERDGGGGEPHPQAGEQAG